MYTFYPIFEGQKLYFKELFGEILILYAVSNQEWVIVARIRYSNFLLRVVIWYFFVANETKSKITSEIKPPLTPCPWPIQGQKNFYNCLFKSGWKLHHIVLKKAPRWPRSKIRWSSVIFAWKLCFIKKSCWRNHQELHTRNNFV